jgi:hypothetical protein
MIKEGRSPDLQRSLSLVDIVECLKETDFQTISGVDSEEVSAFVSWVESAEQSGKWE